MAVARVAGTHPECVTMAIRPETFVCSSVFTVRVLVEHEDDPNMTKIL